VSRALDELLRELGPSLLQRGQRPAERHRQMLDLDGLRDEVVGPRSNRTDGGVQTAERRDHDHRNVRPLLIDPLAELEPGHPVHSQIGDDDIEFGRRHRIQSLFGDAARSNIEPSRLQTIPQSSTHLGVIVDD